MRYAYKIVAGEPGKPGGMVGLYQSKEAARKAWPPYAAYMKRIRVSEEVWQELAARPRAPWGLLLLK